MTPGPHPGRPIGEIIAPIIARALTMRDFQSFLHRCPSSGDRKQLIMAAYEFGALDRDETRLLIEAEGLETA